MDVLSDCLIWPPYLRLGRVSHYAARVSGALCGHFRQMEELLEETPVFGLVDHCTVVPGFQGWRYFLE